MMKTLAVLALALVQTVNTGHPRVPKVVAAPSGPGFTYQRAITQDHTKAGTANSGNYPMYFTGGSYLATVANGGAVQNGNDIAFYADSNLTTQLPCEQVFWSSTTGLGEWHVKVPMLSVSADTVIYVAYGKSGVATSQCAGASTWDSNYLSVYHLGNGATVSPNDSTSNAKNGTLVSSPPATAGQVGGGMISTTGTTQSVSLPSILNLGSGDFTLEGWTYMTGGTGDPQGARFFANSGNGGASLTNAYAYGWRLFGPGDMVVSGVTTATDSWHQVTFTRSGSSLVVYIDGVNQGTGTSSTSVSFDSIASSNMGQITMRLDELRASNTGRSSSYVTATYNNQFSPSTFYSVGAQTAGH